MRIVFVTDALGKGGKERRMLELLKGLTSDPAYTVKLISLSENVEYDVVYQLPVAFEIIPRKFRKDPFTAFRLGKVVSDFKPDLIHSWGILSSILLCPTVLRLRKPFVNGIVADAPAHLKWWSQPYIRTRLSYPYSDAIIGNSRAGLKVYDAPGHKAHCIYNGMDLKRFVALSDPGQIREQFFPGEGKDLFIAVMVAAFEERKDYFTLVEAAVSLLNRPSRIAFLLIGDGVLASAVKAKVPESHRHRICFAGKRADVESLVNACDAGVLLTNSAVHGEGISNSLLEYMAVSKPVLGTRGGGTDELIRDGENGFLLTPGNAAELADKLQYLMDHPEKSSEMGQNGRRLIEAQFDLTLMTENYKKLYDSLLN